MDTKHKRERELPSLFDQRGIMTPLAESQLDDMSEGERTAYQAIHDAYAATMKVEKAISRATQALQTAGVR